MRLGRKIPLATAGSTGLAVNGLDASKDERGVHRSAEDSAEMVGENSSKTIRLYCISTPNLAVCQMRSPFHSNSSSSIPSRVAIWFDWLALLIAKEKPSYRARSFASS